MSWSLNVERDAWRHSERPIRLSLYYQSLELKKDTFVKSAIFNLSQKSDADSFAIEQYIVW